MAGVTKIQRDEFIGRIAPIIQRMAYERGYHIVSPIIAQACIESKYGLSGLAKYHNYFGLKCGSSWKGPSVNMKTKEEYKQGQLSTIRDNFRCFPNMESGVKGYFDFINTKRYTNLKDAATPQQYLERIRADGYATSFSYVTTNMNCIRLNGLTSYDTRPYKTIDEIAQEVINLKWGNGEERKRRLTEAGYNYAMVQQTVNRILKEGK